MKNSRYLCLFVLFLATQSLLAVEHDEPRILRQMGIGEMGDILCYRGAFRKKLGLKTTPLTHCAIDIGDGSVIEWSTGSGESGGRAVIRRRAKIDFIKSAPKYSRVFVKSVSNSRAPGEIVAYAFHYLTNPEIIGHYDPLLNNCQHFAMLCATGEKKSWQADKITRFFERLEQSDNRPLAQTVRTLGSMYRFLTRVAFDDTGATAGL